MEWGAHYYWEPTKIGTSAGQIVQIIKGWYKSLIGSNSQISFSNITCCILLATWAAGVEMVFSQWNEWKDTTKVKLLKIELNCKADRFAKFLPQQLEIGWKLKTAKLSAKV